MKVCLMFYRMGDGIEVKRCGVKFIFFVFVLNYFIKDIGKMYRRIMFFWYFNKNLSVDVIVDELLLNFRYSKYLKCMLKF